MRSLYWAFYFQGQLGCHLFLFKYARGNSDNYISLHGLVNKSSTEKNHQAHFLTYSIAFDSTRTIWWTLGIANDPILSICSRPVQTEAQQSYHLTFINPEDWGAKAGKNQTEGNETHINTGKARFLLSQSFQQRKLNCSMLTTRGSWHKFQTNWLVRQTSLIATTKD